MVIVVLPLKLDVDICAVSPPLAVPGGRCLQAYLGVVVEPDPPGANVVDGALGDGLPHLDTAPEDSADHLRDRLFVLAELGEERIAERTNAFGVLQRGIRDNDALEPGYPQQHGVLVDLLSCVLNDIKPFFLLFFKLFRRFFLLAVRRRTLLRLLRVDRFSFSWHLDFSFPLPLAGMAIDGWRPLHYVYCPRGRKTHKIPCKKNRRKDSGERIDGNCLFVLYEPQKSGTYFYKYSAYNYKRALRNSIYLRVRV